jgi:hypothetical protein
METKPFSIQSPEAIAKQYGGNKQKIAQAMQMGIIDPTAGTLAGMFIDRMRSAAQQEQTPQQTVAQQVMAPQPQAAPPAPPMGAPAGLGATPQAAQMAPPMGQPPAMGQPSAPPPGMAMGGMVPPYASGGLTDLPIPDAMFDEPNNGGYASGGIVAFDEGAEGRKMTPEEEEAERNKIVVNGLRQKNAQPVSLGAAPMFDLPSNIYGMSGDPITNLTNYQDMYTPKTKQQDRLTAAYEEELTPESIKKAKKEDMWMALGQIGAKMASTPGSFLQAASAGMAEAMPGIRASAKERKADQRQLLKNLQEQEGLSNKEAKEAAGIALDMTSKYGSLAQALQDTAFKERWAQMDDSTRRYIAKVSAQAGITQAGIGAEASKYGARYGYEREVLQQDNANQKVLESLIGFGGPLHKAAKEAQAQGKVPTWFRDTLIGMRTTGGGGSEYGAPPPGAVERVGK